MTTTAAEQRTQDAIRRPRQSSAAEPIADKVEVSCSQCDVVFERTRRTTDYGFPLLCRVCERR